MAQQPPTRIPAIAIRMEAGSDGVQGNPPFYQQFHPPSIPHDGDSMGDKWGGTRMMHLFDVLEDNPVLLIVAVAVASMGLSLILWAATVIAGRMRE